MRSSEVVSGSQELSSTLPDGSVSSELLCSHLQGLQGLPSPTFGFLFTTAGEGAVGAFSPPAAGKHSGTGSGTRPPPKSKALSTTLSSQDSRALLQVLLKQFAKNSHSE